VPGQAERPCRLRFIEARGLKRLLDHAPLHHVEIAGR
jgi:hypothetical protein